MEFLQHLAFGLGVALAPAQLPLLLLAWILGALCGALPGVRPVALMALLLPVTLQLSALASLVLLAGVFGGVQHGGLVRATLAGTLERPPGLLAVLGLLRQRQWRLALAAAQLAPLLAAWTGVLALALCSLWLNAWAQQLGAAESLALMLLLLVGAVVLAPGPLLKALPMALLGLLVGLVGLDTQSGTVRFAIDLPVLGLSNMHGIGILAIAIGVFGYGDVIHRLAHPSAPPEALAARTPGGAAGAPAGPQAAAGSRPMGPLRARLLSSLAWLPMLALGLPSQGVLALVAASLVMHQIPLGARMLDGRPELFWGLLASLLLGNLLLWLLLRPLLAMWPGLQRLPYRWSCCWAPWGSTAAAAARSMSGCWGLPAWPAMPCAAWKWSPRPCCWALCWRR